MTSPDGADHAAEEIKALARDYAELAVTTLVDVCRERDPETGLPSNPGAARAVAAKTLLQVGDLMPERRQTKRVDHHIYDERQAHLEALRRLSDTKRLAAPEVVMDAEFKDV